MMKKLLTNFPLILMVIAISGCGGASVDQQSVGGMLDQTVVML